MRDLVVLIEEQLDFLTRVVALDDVPVAVEADDIRAVVYDRAQNHLCFDPKFVSSTLKRAPDSGSVPAVLLAVLVRALAEGDFFPFDEEPPATPIPGDRLTGMMLAQAEEEKLLGCVFTRVLPVLAKLGGDDAGVLVRANAIRGGYEFRRLTLGKPKRRW